MYIKRSRSFSRKKRKSSARKKKKSSRRKKSMHKNVRAQGGKMKYIWSQREKFGLYEGITRKKSMVILAKYLKWDISELKAH